MTSTAERELTFTRTFNAPIQLVFKVWTDPAHIVNWWGPQGFTNTIHKMEAKPGGEWIYTMHGPDGKDYENYVAYHEVVKPHRITFSHDTGPDDIWFEVTVELREKEKQTELTMTMLFPTQEARDRIVKESGANEGNKQTMDKLEKYLATLN